MTASSPVAFDHLDLDDVARELIANAVGDSRRVYLAPLDKGLSGADLWRARWELPGSSALSALHVFKIGALDKLRREETAIRTIAAAIDPDITYVHLFTDARHDLGLLRQYFSGGSPERATSLRTHIRACSTSDDAVECIDRLYLHRMTRWHADAALGNAEDHTYGEALDWWISRADITGAADRLGCAAVEHSLQSRFGLGIDVLTSFIDELSRERSSFVIGPVHGDLHAQNILVDATGRLHLIDYAWCAERWRAIDFLMLECSLKFVVTPRHAHLDDLLAMEAALGGTCTGGPSLSAVPALYDRELSKIASTVSRIRELALELGAAASVQQYLCGLILLTAGLTSIPYTMNHPYMVHSLGVLHRQVDGAP